VAGAAQAARTIVKIRTTGIICKVIPGAAPLLVFFILPPIYKINSQGYE
jgi:hypothetical protein